MGTSGGAFAERACVYGIDFSGIILWNRFDWESCHRNDLYWNFFRLWYYRLIKTRNFFLSDVEADTASLDLEHNV